MPISKSSFQYDSTVIVSICAVSRKYDFDDLCSDPNIFHFFLLHLFLSFVVVFLRSSFVVHSIIRINITIHAESFAVIISISMLAIIRFACILSTKYMVTMITHPFRIMRCISMFAFGDYTLWAATSLFRFLFLD